VPVQVIGLLVFAGLLHSLGNLLSKRGRDAQAYLWLVLVAVTVGGLVPVLLLYQPLPAIGWGYVVFSGALEALYYVLLGRAYQIGDFSLVYPLARGSAPLFATLLALVLFHDHLAWTGAAGILLIVGGIYALHVPAFDRKGLLLPFLMLRRGVSRLALLIGLVIASYSVVDKVGVTYTSPLLYIYLLFVVAAALLAPYMLRARRIALGQELRTNAVRILITAVLFLGAYLLVLFALRTTQVGYVASVREVSVVFAAVLGTLVLREPFGEKKILGSLLIFAGIVCIGLAG
jgi:drug/metabolite transporter (DMT)-like permease